MFLNSNNKLSNKRLFPCIAGKEMETVTLQKLETPLILLLYQTQFKDFKILINLSNKKLLVLTASSLADLKWIKYR
jgi:hypothetical protein